MTTHPHLLDRLHYLAAEAPSLLGPAGAVDDAWADVFYERTHFHEVGLHQCAEHGRIGPFRPRQVQRIVEGAAIRVLRGDQVGFAATPDLSQRALREAARGAALQVGLRGRSPRPVRLPEPTLRERLAADAPEFIASSEKVALVRAAADAAFALDARVCRVNVQYRDRVRRIIVATSDARFETDTAVLIELRLEVVLDVDGREIRGRSVVGTTSGFGYFFLYTPEQVAHDAVQQAVVRSRARSVRGGTMPVVLAQGWSGVWLHEVVGHTLEVDTPESLAGRIGEVVAAPAIHLVDDATWPEGRGSFAVDDEGTPAQRTVLIERGRICGVLTDRKNARDRKLPCTGNARRQDYRHVPLPRMTNLLLLSGDAEPEALVEEVKSGLYVKTVGNGLVRPGKGFAFEVLEGYRIEKGRLLHPVTGVCIRGKGLGTLREVEAVGNDMQVDTGRGLCRKAGQIVPVGVGMPTVLIRSMQVDPVSLKTESPCDVDG